MKKQLLASSLAAMIALFGPVSSFAEDLNKLQDQKKQSEVKKDQLQGELDTVHQNMDALEKKLNTLKSQMKVIEGKIAGVQAQIAVTQGKISDTEADIQATEVELAKKKKILARNIRLMYSKGDASYMEFLFRSEDISDFLYRFDALKNVAKANRTLYDDVRRELKNLNDKKKVLEEHKAELDKKNSELIGLKSDLDKNIAEQNKILAALAAHANELQQDINEMNGAIDSINAKIADEVKRREEERKKREAAGTPPPKNQLIGSGFMDPMTPGTYTVTSPFGYRIHPITGQRIFHQGIDLGTSLNSPIFAADSGTVLYAGPASGFGNWIVIDHNNGFLTVYGHMYNDGLLVSPGQQVEKGQHIANAGSNGHSTGVHLHFEINSGSLGNRVNPANYINF